MNRYEKLATFLVRLACVFLWTWSAVRLALFLYASLLTQGFRHGNPWPLLVQSVLPGAIGVVLHFVKPRIVSYLSRDLGD